MELRKPKTLCVFNEHYTGVGYIYADLENGGADQRVCFAAAKPFHDLLFLWRRNSTVEQLAAKRMQTFAPQFVFGCGGLGIELFTFIDQRINHIQLATGFQLCAPKTKHLAELRPIAPTPPHFPSLSP